MVHILPANFHKFMLDLGIWIKLDNSWQEVYPGNVFCWIFALLSMERLPTQNLSLSINMNEWILQIPLHAPCQLDYFKGSDQPRDLWWVMKELAQNQGVWSQGPGWRQGLLWKLSLLLLGVSGWRLAISTITLQMHSYLLAQHILLQCLHHQPPKTRLHQIKQLLFYQYIKVVCANYRKI